MMSEDPSSAVDSSNVPPGKRPKNDSGPRDTPNGNYQQSAPSPFPPQGPPHQQPPFPQGTYNGPPPGGSQPPYPMQQPGFNMWQGQQQQPMPYGNQMPPWQPGQPGPGPPPGPMYRHPGPDRPENWNGYRGQPPPSSGGRSSPKNPSSGGSGPFPPNAPPQFPPWQRAQQGWPPQQQWGPGGPPPMWQQGPPMMQGPSPTPGQPMPGAMPPHAKMWAGGPQQQGMRPSASGRPPRGSPDGMMAGFPPGAAMNGMMPGQMCKPIADGSVSEVGTETGDGRDDDGDSKDGDGDRKGKMSKADKDKARGSYRCGKCGEPKKGHICPYQPKIARRPDEPPPETRCAAIQVEMDEFMTLRRLNIEIQGLPESYATAGHMAGTMVVGEPHPYSFDEYSSMAPTGSMGETMTRMVGMQASPPPHVASVPAPDSANMLKAGSAKSAGETN